MLAADGPSRNQHDLSGHGARLGQSESPASFHQGDARTDARGKHSVAKLSDDAGEVFREVATERCGTSVLAAPEVVEHGRAPVVGSQGPGEEAAYIFMKATTMLPGWPSWACMP